MANSINTNIAAYFAQTNIAKAAAQSALSVARLSSGIRIQRAADDISGLAIGTSLQTSVSSLRTALTNAAQGTSLLQVADGALSQISSILQRQKAIASQAGSGSLSATERAFLNQEFQALSSEIDRLTESTNFNNVQLLNGDIAGSVGISTNADAGTSADIAGAASILSFGTAVALDGDDITIGGVNVEFTTSLPGTSGAVGKVTVGSSVANTVLNLAKYLNELNDPRLANLYFEASAGDLLVRYTGGDLAATVTLSVSANFTTAANATAADLSIVPSQISTGLDANRTTYVGDFSGSLLVTAATAAATAGSPIYLNNIRSNADFVGKLGQGNMGTFQATYIASDTLSLSLQVGDILYTSDQVDIIAAGVRTLTFTGHNSFGAAAGGTFTLNLNGTTLTTSQDLESQVQADAIAQQINDGFAGITFLQNRDVTNVTNGQIVQLGGIDVANLQGLSFDFLSDNFTNVTISDFTITAPASGGTDAVFEAIINGELYRSFSGTGNQIGEGKVIALQNVNDSNKLFTFVTGGTNIASSTTVVLDLATQDKADAVADAFKAALGITSGTGGLQFQVGSSTSDVLDVTIGSATTTSLFGGLDLNVLTQDAAATASSVIEDAISSVTALRANVGALQSRFEFASSNITIAIQNQDAARSDLLETDIAAEATSYATSQVKLQAGISVLAQANQQLQSLLKLIG